MLLLYKWNLAKGDTNDHGAAVGPTALSLVSALNTLANHYAVTHLHPSAESSEAVVAF